jgi:hypothetical protein
MSGKSYFPHSKKDLKHDMFAEITEVVVNAMEKAIIETYGIVVKEENGIKWVRYDRIAKFIEAVIARKEEAMPYGLTFKSIEKLVSKLADKLSIPVEDIRQAMDEINQEEVRRIAKNERAEKIPG